MKTSLSLLLLLSAGLASAQFGPGRMDRRDDRTDGRYRFEGLYTSSQRDGTIVRTLRLAHDGTAEIVTEVRGRIDDRRRGEDRLTDREVDSFGRIAERAARGRAVHNLGHWTLRDRGLVVQLDELSSGVENHGHAELPLHRDGGDLLVERDTDLYGHAMIRFHREGGWNDRAEGSPRYGFLRYDNERLRIDGIDLVDGRGAGGLVRIRAEGRQIEIRGEIRRRGDEIVFRMPGDRDDRGSVTLTLRDGRVESIRGAGRADRHRVSFEN